MFASLTLLSLALSSVMASPIVERVNALSCESTPQRSGTLNIAVPNGDNYDDYTFSLGNVKTKDHFGNQAKVLVGNGASPTTFDFYACNSTYMNTKPTGDAYTLTYYGILRAQGQTQHCLQTQSGSVDTASQVFTNSYCSYVDDSTQQQQTFLFYPNDASIKFQSTRLGNGQHQHPTHFSVDTNNNDALQLVAGSSKGPVVSMAPN